MTDEHRQRVLHWQQLRAVPLIAVMEKYGALGGMKRMGTQMAGACPIHQGENRKAFVVDPRSNSWRCFGRCDRGGGTLEFVAAMDNISISEAAHRIGRWFAIGTSFPSIQRRRETVSKLPTMKAFSVEDRGRKKKTVHRASGPE